MTTRQLFGLCIAISMFIHIWAVQHDWSPSQEPGSSDQIIVPLDFDVAVSTAKDGIALEQGFEEPESKEDCEDAARRLRRLAVRKFLRQVHAAVEQRKFLPGSGDLSGLIGNVRYSFKILPNDSFTAIRLVRSSGDSRLDQAAKRAIAAASGVTNRPKILRGQTFSISITVKYQYSM